MLIGFVNVNNTYFFNNTSIEGGIFLVFENPYLINNLISIESSVFESNSALFSLENCYFSILNSKFQNNLDKIFDLTDSNLYIANITVINHICSGVETGCLIASQENSNIIMENNIFFNIVTQTEGFIFSLDSQIIMDNSTFSLVFSAKNLGSCVFATTSDIKISDCEFQNISCSCVYLQSSNFSLADSSFLWNVNFFSSDYDDGTVFCDSCSEFSINNSIFQNQNFITQGASVQISSTNNIGNNEYLIENCSFINNSAIYYGGALKIFSGNLSVINSMFIGNSAGSGGAIFYDVSIDSFQDSHLNLINNNFINNIGYSEGGAITWTYNEPNYVSTNIFEFNQAVYGNDIATLPIKINLKVISEENENLLGMEENNMNYINVSSGSEINGNFVFEILDIYDNIVTTIETNK